MVVLLQQINRFVTEGAADWASVLGVVIALVGFIVTIVNVRRSKRAAESAERIAAMIRQDAARVNAVSDCTAAVDLMDQIRALQREGNLRPLPDKYSSLRRTLVTIRAANQELTPQQQTSLQSAIATLSEIERKVERALASTSPSLDTAKLNSTIAKVSDSLQEILVHIKIKIGR